MFIFNMSQQDWFNHQLDKIQQSPSAFSKCTKLESMIPLHTHPQQKIHCLAKGKLSTFLKVTKTCHVFFVVFWLDGIRPPPSICCHARPGSAPYELLTTGKLREDWEVVKTGWMPSISLKLGKVAIHKKYKNLPPPNKKR